MVTQRGLVLCLASPQLMRPVQRCTLDCETHLCRTEDELANMLHGGAAPRLVVLEMTDRRPHPLTATLPRILEGIRHAPVLVRARLTPHVSRDVLALASLCADLRVSLEGYDEFSGDCQRALAGSIVPTATQTLLTRVVQSSPARVRHLIAAAAIASRKRLYVTELCSLCDVPQRTLEWQLGAAGIVRARDLLGTMLSLHAFWWLDVMRWPLKKVVSVLGFRSPAALTNYIRRHVGISPRQAVQSLGFRHFLDPASIRRCRAGNAAMPEDASAFANVV